MKEFIKGEVDSWIKENVKAEEEEAEEQENVEDEEIVEDEEEAPVGKQKKKKGIQTPQQLSSELQVLINIPITFSFSFNFFFR